MAPCLCVSNNGVRVLENCSSLSGVSHGGTKARSWGSVLFFRAEEKYLRVSVSLCEESSRLGVYTQSEEE